MNNDGEQYNADSTNESATESEQEIRQLVAVECQKHFDSRFAEFDQQQLNLQASQEMENERQIGEVRNISEISGKYFLKLQEIYEIPYNQFRIQTLLVMLAVAGGVVTLAENVLIYAFLGLFGFKMVRTFLKHSDVRLGIKNFSADAAFEMHRLVDRSFEVPPTDTKGTEALLEESTSAHSKLLDEFDEVYDAVSTNDEMANKQFQSAQKYLYVSMILTAMETFMPSSSEKLNNFLIRELELHFLEWFGKLAHATEGISSILPAI